MIILNFDKQKEFIMKKMIISCLFVLLCSVLPVQAEMPIQKILSLGQYTMDGFGVNYDGQFIAYDGQCATIRRQLGYGTVRICKDRPAHVYIFNTVVKMQYDGGSDLRISYEK
jgi:hypothetical protein